MKKAFTLRMVLFLGAVLLCAPLFGPSCAAGFDPPGKVNKLRIFSVEADKPYAQPGETVTFKMNLIDALDPANARPVEIVWLGGCFDPEGDQYFGCYPSLAKSLSSLQSSGGPPPPGTFAAGIGLDTFQLPIPSDIVTRRPPPAAGPYAGEAFVFFVACAGNVKPIPPEGTGVAGGFPLGCFDDTGKRLGPDSFVSGYTEIYSFADHRTNANPAIDSLDLDGTPIPDDTSDLTLTPHVKACSVTEDQRKLTGCSAPDPFSECKAYKIKVHVEKDVAEIDPDGLTPDNKPLHETVWASYFSDGGDFDFDTKLVSDATTGYTDTQEVNWAPPPDPGLVTFWVVLRDSRGGSTTLKRFVTVDK